MRYSLLIRRIPTFLPLLGTVLAAVVVWWAVNHVFKNYHYQEILDGLAHIGRPELMVAGVLCIANYAVLTLYDLLAFQYLGKKLGYPRIGFAAFVSYTFSHNIGFAALSGGAVRLRLYTGWGLTPGEVARIFVFSGLHFWLGLLLLAGVGFAVSPEVFAGSLGNLSFLVSGACVVLLGTYFAACARGWEVNFSRTGPVHLPTFQLALKGVVVAAVDWLLAASVLYALLPQDSGVSFFFFLNAFVAAQIAGVLSHVPGGLGVFESVMVLTVGRTTPASAFVGVLVVFRLIYYLIPFCIGVLALTLYELRRRRHFGKSISAGTERVLSLVMPQGLAVAIFLAGAVLLTSGATPALPGRLKILGELVPVHLLELSHFLNSLIGVWLLVLAWGIRKRLSAAYWSVMVSSAVGAVVSLTKGLDYEEASYLVLVVVALYLGRRHFTRHSALLTSIDPRLIFAISGILLCTVVIGLFSYKYVEYSNVLWWQFALDGDASRFMRGTLGALMVLFVLCLRLVLRPSRKPFVPPDSAALDTLHDAVSNSPRTMSNLVYLGDKEILKSENGNAFLMYRFGSNSGVALGDPIGDESQFSDLVWEFRELCDRYDVTCSFYQVSSEQLPLYIDAGLQLQKLGEEAVVPLQGFSLEGRQWKSFRQTERKMAREGYTFEVCDAEKTAALVPILQSISDEWLSHKSTREKAFSLGRFSPEYIVRFPLALVRNGEQIVAFANIWAGAPGTELSVDLMRHTANAPNGTMDFLFISLLNWGSTQGFREFNLGMAPFSGIRSHRLGTLWSKLGALIYQHGEHFYNFEGLRSYKEKFSPEWRPKYLAFSRARRLPAVLADVGALVSGGLGGVFSR